MALDGHENENGQHLGFLEADEKVDKDGEGEPKIHQKLEVTDDSLAVPGSAPDSFTPTVDAPDSVGAIDRVQRRIAAAGFSSLPAAAAAPSGFVHVVDVTSAGQNTVIEQISSAADSGLAAPPKNTGVDPFVSRDPWRQANGLSTPPGRTQRSQGASSGLTPDLMENRHRVQEFLRSTPRTQPMSPTPSLPSQSTDPVVQAILEGVNELRRNSVDRTVLAEFHELQSQEFQAFVKAENEPLHSSVGCLTSDVQALASDNV